MTEKLLPQIPVLTEYLAVKDELQARIDKLNAITTLTEENRKEAKTAVAEINKVKDRISRYRIDETNKFLEYINPYVDKCKELEKMCVEGVASIKEKINTLEEEERNQKIGQVKALFEYELSFSKYSSFLKFEYFFEKSMGNKTASFGVIEKQLKEWIEHKTSDIEFIKKNTDEPDTVLSIYFENGLNVTGAIEKYQERFKSEAEIAGMLAQETQEQNIFEKKLDLIIKIKQLPKSKVVALQSFLDNLKVEWEVEKA